MRPALLDLLRCPRSRSCLHLVEPVYRGDAIESGMLASEDGRYRYPIVNFVPRFVSQSNYADSFGFEWNKFPTTQLDSSSGHPISADRFWRATGWAARDLAGHWVLDAGCGAGRFAEIALRAGARVVAIDFSDAVNACQSNLGRHPNLHVVQADIYSLPFKTAQFSFVYSLGVLQHTPDVRKAFFALLPMMKSEGRICVDVYERSWKSILLPKYWLRCLTKHVPKAQLFSTLERVVPAFLRLSCLAARVPLVGGQLRRLVPVANYNGILPLNEQQQMQWSLLDTLDWLSPAYDSPQTRQAVSVWLTEAGLENAAVVKAGHLVARGKAPLRPAPECPGKS